MLNCRLFHLETQSLAQGGLAPPVFVSYVSEGDGPHTRLLLYYDYPSLFRNRKALPN
jgi:hypothetical protein